MTDYVEWYEVHMQYRPGTHPRTVHPIAYESEDEAEEAWYNATLDPDVVQAVKFRQSSLRLASHAKG